MDLSDKILGRGESAATKIYGAILNFLLALLIVALFAVIVTTSMFALCRVNGDSMKPTLVDTQFVLVEKHKSEIRRGDVVVFHKEDKSQQYIKRVMGMGGDTFRFVVEGAVVELYVNGEKPADDFPMDVEYWHYRPSEIGLKLNEEYIVPEGKILALGDNRNNSKDSRYDEIGFVDFETELLGRADVFLKIGSFTEWIVEMIYGVPFKSEYRVSSKD